MADRYSFKVLQILGEAVDPYHRTFERLDAMVPKVIAADEEWPTFEAVDFFEGDGEGTGRDRQAARRRACAVAWSMAKHGELVGWLTDCGVSIDDAVSEGAAGAPA